MSMRTVRKVGVCVKPREAIHKEGELELKTRGVRMVAKCVWSWAVMESEVRKEGFTLDIKR